MTRALLILTILLSGHLYAQTIPGLVNEEVAPTVVAAKEITPNLQSRLVVDGELKSFFQWVLFQGEGLPFYIEKDKLVKNLSTIVTAKVLRKLNKFEGKFITSTQLEELKINAFFNQSTLDIELKIPYQLKQQQRINLAGRGYRQQDQDHLKTSSGFSSYLNTYLSQSYVDLGDARGYHAGERQTNLELVNYLNGFTLENQVDYSSQRSNKWKREKSILTYDFEKSMSRIQVGDITTLTTGRQRQFTSGGISYSRIFSINPNFLRTNIHTNQIILERPSTVEIFLNGGLVRSEKLLPGPVDIRDFPFYSGENAVLIRITDDLGHIREEYFSDFFSPQLLREGTSEYSVSLEAPRDETQENDYKTDEAFVSGFYRYGLSKTKVAGVYIQGNNDELLLGSTASTINKWGVGKFEVAASNNNLIDARGYFAEANISTLLFKQGKMSPYALSTILQYRSEDFYRQSRSIEAPVNTKYLVDMSVRQNTSSALQSSFGFRKFYTDRSNHRTLYYISGSWNVNRDLQVSFKATSAFRPEEETTVLISVYWSDKSGRNQVFSNFDPERESVSTRYQYNPIYQIDALRVTGGSNITPGAYGLDGSLEYYHRRFNTKLSQSTSISRAEPKSNALHSTQLSGSFALALAGGAVAISRPIYNSFAIVGVDKKIGADKVMINRYNDLAQAQIDSWGSAVLSNITPYFNEKVIVDTASLPVGVSLEQDHFIARTGYKSGVYIKAKVLGYAAIQAKLFYPGNHVVSLEVGSVIKINPDFSRVEVGRFFTNEDGEVFIEKLSPGNYKLELDNTALAAYSFSLTKSQIGIIQLKDIHLRRSQKIMEDQ